MKKIIFNSVDETQAFASNYAKDIDNGKVIALIGDLGTGKTTFSQGFAHGMGTVSYTHLTLPTKA